LDAEREKTANLEKERAAQAMEAIKKAAEEK
jgi:hypothetical protein